MEEMLLGVTDRTILVFIPDPASTDGSGKTGLVAANLTVSYSRAETDNDVTVTDVTSSLNNLSALTDAHNDWGLLEVSNTLAPGLYRLDVADAVFASGAWYAVVYVMITTSAAAATPKAFRLVAVNALDTVRMGLTALPNAVADGAGGLPISDAGGLDLDAKLANTNEVTAARMGALTDWINGGRLDLILDIIAADTTTDIPALIAALNNLSSAQAQSAADAALVARNLDKLVSVSGTADSGTTSDMVDAARTEADGDYWVGSVILFTSGAISGQSRTITSFNPATDTISWSSAIPLSQAVTTETYVILPAGLESLLSILQRLPAFLVSGRMDSSVGAMAANVLTATAIASNAITSAKIAANAIGDSQLAADVETMIRTALGLATANLDTQLDALPTNSELATAITTGLTTGLTEGYRATGAIGSVRDLLYEILAGVLDHSITGTTKTIRNIAGTAQKTYTLDSAVTPTSITETT